MRRWAVGGDTLISRASLDELSWEPRPRVSRRSISVV